MVEKKVMEVVDFGDDEEGEEGGDGVLKRREMEMVEVVVGNGGGRAWPELGRSSPAMVAGGGWSGVGVRLGSLGGGEEVKKENEEKRKEKEKK